jgi:hypothetical protein
MEEKYYGVYDGKELKAVGLKQQCDKYSIDRRLISTQLVEVEPDWNNEVFMKKYLLSDELYECPLTESEYKVLFDLEYTKINSRMTVIENIKKILNEKTLKEAYKLQYEEIYLVGHNVKYDIEIMRREGLDLSKCKAIDTLQLARYLDKESESHRLTYLLYAKEEVLNATRELVQLDQIKNVAKIQPMSAHNSLLKRLSLPKEILIL